MREQARRRQPADRPGTALGHRADEPRPGRVLGAATQGAARQGAATQGGATQGGATQGRAAGAPWTVTQPFGAQLASEQHHGPQILGGRSEPELGHEAGAELEPLAAQTGAGRDGCCADGGGDDDGEAVDRALPDPPHTDAAGQVGRPGAQPRRIVLEPCQPRGEALPADQHGAGDRRQPAGKADGVGEHRRPDVQRTHDHTEQHAARRPRGARAGELGGDELSGDAAAERQHECGGAKALHHRSREDGSAGQRREEQVADVGLLDRDRPALGAVAQPDGDGENDRDPKQRGGPADDQIGGDLVVQQPVDGIGRPHDDRAPHEREQVDPVGDVEPLDVAEPALGAGATELTHDSDRMFGHRTAR